MCEGEGAEASDLRDCSAFGGGEGVKLGELDFAGEGPAVREDRVGRDLRVVEGSEFERARV